MKVIIPKHFLEVPEKVERAIENALDMAALAIKADFGVTAQTWEDKPTFTIEKAKGKRVVDTRHQLYLWTTGGTRPHIIRARRKPWLAWSSQFTPKTRPRRIGSTAGSRGPVDSYAKGVMHPGTKAREFEMELAERWTQRLPALMQRAIDSEFGE